MALWHDTKIVLKLGLTIENGETLERMGLFYCLDNLLDVTENRINNSDVSLLCWVCI